MSNISEIYSNQIIEDLIKNMLDQGTIPTLSNLLAAIQTHVETHSTDEPQTDYDTHKVDYGEISSVAKFNTTTDYIHKDLRVLYKSLTKVAGESSKSFERWRGRVDLIERRLNKLLNRISSLLLMEYDTVGYFNYFYEDFNDLDYVDQTNSTVRVDLDHQHISIGTSTTSTTKHILSIPSQNISFTLLTNDGVIAQSQVANTRLSNIIDGTKNYYQNKVISNKSTVLSGEIKIKLTSSVSISRIDVDLHTSNSNNAVEITPLYSTDGKNWKNLPISNYSLSVLDTATFQTPAITASYIKILMTKSGPDYSSGDGFYTYEFGVDEISLFSESYDTSTSGYTFISNPISITNPETGEVQPFNKLSLDVCESFEDGYTDIAYSVAVSNDSTVPVSSSTTWFGINPSGRDSRTKPYILNFDQLDFFESDKLGISYNAISSNTAFINPKAYFTLLKSFTGSTATYGSYTSSAQRYIFHNPEDRILELQMDKDITISKDTLQVWRNVNTQNSTTLVRENPIGWGVDGDYYTCVVLVKNKNGIEIDFGNQPVVIDEKEKRGNVQIKQGVHKIKVYRNNWIELANYDFKDLAALRSADSLYPYNHKYLIEGITYPDGYTEEEIYKGFDIVAEYLMTEVSPMELVNNTNATNYSKFAIDLDTEDSNRSPSDHTEATKVFVLKVDHTNADFLNEKFILRFHPQGTTYNYCRFRAILTTEDSEKTPFLQSYRLKFGDGVIS